MAVLLDAPGDPHFMRFIQGGVVSKLDGISRLVKEDKVVGGECFDYLVARRISVVVYFLG